MGNAEGANVADPTALVDRVADGRLDLVRDAFTELERRHTRGKIVLVP